MLISGPRLPHPGLEQRAADGPGVAPRRGSRHGGGACGRAAGAAGPRWAWGKWPGSGEKWAKIIRLLPVCSVLNTPKKSVLNILFSTVNSRKLPYF